MRPVGFVLAVFVVALAIAPLTRGDDEKKAPADSDAITKIVNTYFENSASSEKIEKNAALFVQADVSVVGIAKGAGRDTVWSKTVTDLIPEQKKELQRHGRDIPYKVDSVKVELVDKALAVARLTYSNEFVKFRGVFTFTSEGGSWTIASFVFETRRPDQE
ncbi:MAG TPA: nuclear transport factor 2 family protein [Gemmataceae bacterium]|nr:nuclear transport factor 2 family protein [Gemmataceae bacterium]